MNRDLDAIRQRAEHMLSLFEAEAGPPTVADDVLALLDDNRQLEDIRKDLLTIIKTGTKERDRLVAENVRLKAVAEVARKIVARDDEWLAQQKNPDGSCKTTYIRDVLVTLLRRRLDEYDRS